MHYSLFTPVQEIVRPEEHCRDPLVALLALLVGRRVLRLLRGLLRPAPSRTTREAYKVILPLLIVRPLLSFLFLRAHTE